MQNKGKRKADVVEALVAVAYLLGAAAQVAGHEGSSTSRPMTAVRHHGALGDGQTSAADLISHDGLVAAAGFCEKLGTLPQGKMQVAVANLTARACMHIFVPLSFLLPLHHVVHCAVDVLLCWLVSLAASGKLVICTVNTLWR